jgi:RNA polymerase sigma-70 factor (ECF subfamily)
MPRSHRPDPSFEAAFDGLHSCALGAARRIVDRHTAEDLAAETMARVYARWRTLRDVSYQEAWAVRVATNLALNVVRRGRPPVPDPRPAPSTEDVVVLRADLVDAVRALPRRQREVVALSYLADLPEADVAAALGISTGSVKTHLHRGLAALRTSIGPDTEELRPCPQ